MKFVDLRYGVTFGKGDSSNWIDYEIELTDEEEKIYDEAIANGILLCEVRALEPALDRAYKEIEEIEIENCLDFGDDFAKECLGRYYIEADELNDLVKARDTHALEFFGLENATDEEIEKWDANNLDELPYVCDFDEEFEPDSPFNQGWDLHVEFVDPNE